MSFTFCGLWSMQFSEIKNFHFFQDIAILYSHYPQPSPWWWCVCLHNMNLAQAEEARGKTAPFLKLCEHASSTLELPLSFGNDSAIGHQMWTKHPFLQTCQLSERKQVYMPTACHVLVVAHTLLLIKSLLIFLCHWAVVRVYSCRNSRLMSLII